jgi:hypothetical protein
MVLGISHFKKALYLGVTVDIMPGFPGYPCQLFIVDVGIDGIVS